MAEKLQATLKTPTRPKELVTCPDCGTSFGRQFDLKRHIIPKVACPVADCNKSFRTDKENDFMIHVEKEHPGLDSQRSKRYFKGTMPAWRNKYSHAKTIFQIIKTYPFHYLAFVYQTAPKEPLPSLKLSKHQHNSLTSQPC